jgi:hypothetical protein
MNLLDKTTFMLPLVRAHQSWREIATGADVGLEWLKKLQAGEIENPGVVSIQKLHDYLERSLTSKENAA